MRVPPASLLEGSVNPGALIGFACELAAIGTSLQLAPGQSAAPGADPDHHADGLPLDPGDRRGDPASCRRPDDDLADLPPRRRRRPGGGGDAIPRRRRAGAPAGGAVARRAGSARPCGQRNGNADRARRERGPSGGGDPPAADRQRGLRHHRPQGLRQCDHPRDRRRGRPACPDDVPIHRQQGGAAGARLPLRHPPAPAGLEQAMRDA